MIIRVEAESVGGLPIDSRLLMQKHLCLIRTVVPATKMTMLLAKMPFTSNHVASHARPSHRHRRHPPPRRHRRYRPARPPPQLHLRLCHLRGITFAQHILTSSACTKVPGKRLMPLRAHQTHRYAGRTPASPHWRLRWFVTNCGSMYCVSRGGSRSLRELVLPNFWPD